MYLFVVQRGENKDMDEGMEKNKAKGRGRFDTYVQEREKRVVRRKKEKRKVSGYLAV